MTADELLDMYGEFMLEHSSLVSEFPAEVDEDGWVVLHLRKQSLAPLAPRNSPVAVADENVEDPVEAFKKDVAELGVGISPKNLDVLFDAEDPESWGPAPVITLAPAGIAEQLEELERLNHDLPRYTLERRTTAGPSARAVTEFSTLETVEEDDMADEAEYGLCRDEDEDEFPSFDSLSPDGAYELQDIITGDDDSSSTDSGSEAEPEADDAEGVDPEANLLVRLYPREVGNYDDVDHLMSMEQEQQAFGFRAIAGHHYQNFLVIDVYQEPEPEEEDWELIQRAAADEELLELMQVPAEEVVTYEEYFGAQALTFFEPVTQRDVQYTALAQLIHGEGADYTCVDDESDGESLCSGCQEVSDNPEHMLTSQEEPQEGPEPEEALHRGDDADEEFLDLNDVEIDLDNLMLNADDAFHLARSTNEIIEGVPSQPSRFPGPKSKFVNYGDFQFRRPTLSVRTSLETIVEDPEREEDEDEGEFSDSGSSMVFENRRWFVTQLAVRRDDFMDDEIDWVISLAVRRRDFLDDEFDDEFDFGVVELDSAGNNEQIIQEAVIVGDSAISAIWTTAVPLDGFLDATLETDYGKKVLALVAMPLAFPPGEHPYVQSSLATLHQKYKTWSTAPNTAQPSDPDYDMLTYAKCLSTYLLEHIKQKPALMSGAARYYAQAIRHGKYFIWAEFRRVVSLDWNPDAPSGFPGKTLGGDVQTDRGLDPVHLSVQGTRVAVEPQEQGILFSTARDGEGGHHGASICASVVIFGGERPVSAC
jgi:hypothetical protein